MAKPKWTRKRQQTARRWERFWQTLGPRYVKPVNLNDRCRRCNAIELQWLSTQNEWQYYCKVCDERYRDLDCEVSLKEDQANFRKIMQWDSHD